MPIWWRRARFSSSRAARERKIENTVAKSIVKESCIGRENYETTITLTSSDISRFSRGTTALSRHRTPQPGVDHAAAARSVSLGSWLPISSARPRCHPGRDLVAMTKGLGMEEVISAARSPWQNPYVERLIGSIRRECLDHIIVWNQRSLRRTLRSYFSYYQRSRTHLALPRTLQSREAWRNQNAGESWRFLTSEDSTIATNATPLRIVRRCSTTMPSDILPWSCESTQTVREPRADFIPATNSFLHSSLCVPEHLAPRLQCFAQLLRQTANRCRGGFR